MTPEWLNGANPSGATEMDLDEGDERNDFAKDEMLRHLPLERWFATADITIPMWWH
jgi:hypothetical protein